MKLLSSFFEQSVTFHVGSFKFLLRLLHKMEAKRLLNWIALFEQNANWLSFHKKIYEEVQSPNGQFLSRCRFD